jgi:hypothetical protein
MQVSTKTVGTRNGIFLAGIKMKKGWEFKTLSSY